ncbi:MAG: flagellar hook-length control protein FliK [Candidatus Margulisbacteria bacterium]|nr:flagellar hook-length control protein FliK [Candidatus Margulisiibacteriota bacterium]
MQAVSFSNIQMENILSDKSFFADSIGSDQFSMILKDQFQQPELADIKQSDTPQLENNMLASRENVRYVQQLKQQINGGTEAVTSTNTDGSTKTSMGKTDTNEEKMLEKLSKLIEESVDNKSKATNLLSLIFQKTSKTDKPEKSDSKTDVDSLTYKKLLSILHQMQMLLTKLDQYLPANDEESKELVLKLNLKISLLSKEIKPQLDQKDISSIEDLLNTVHTQLQTLKDKFAPNDIKTESADTGIKKQGTEKVAQNTDNAKTGNTNSSAGQQQDDLNSLLQSLSDLTVQTNSTDISSQSGTDKTSIKEFVQNLQEKFEELLTAMDGKILDYKQKDTVKTVMITEPIAIQKPEKNVNIETAKENEITFQGISMNDEANKTNIKITFLKDKDEVSKELVFKWKEKTLSAPQNNEKSEDFIQSLQKELSQPKEPVQTAKPFTPNTERIANIEKQYQVINQFKNFVTLTKLKGQTELTLQLHPRELGDIKVSLTREHTNSAQEASLLTAKFQVNSDVVKSILESNFNQLKDALAQNGHLAAISVEVNTQGSNGQSFNNLLEQDTKNRSGFDLGKSNNVAGINPNDPSLSDDYYNGALNSIA